MVSPPEDLASPLDATAAVELAVSALSLTGTKVSDNLRHAVTLLHKSVKQKETRLLTGRLLRQTAAIRKQLTREAILAFLSQHLPADDVSRVFLQSQLEQVRQRDREGVARFFLWPLSCTCLIMRPDHL